MERKNLVKMAGVSALAVFVAFAFVIATPAIAASATNTVKLAHTKTTGDISTITWMSNEKIVTDGYHGFGMLTDKEHDAVIITTTHGGIKDSSAQDGVTDADWHNHFVVLGEGDNPYCGDEHYVKDIIFESVGDVVVKNKSVKASNLPASLTGTSALTGQPLTITPGNDFAVALAFDLEPIVQNGDLKAVCVVDIQMVDKATGYGLFK